MIELRDAQPDQAEEQESAHESTQTKPYVTDFQIDTDLEIMFPDEYVSNISERIRLYKELNEIESEEQLTLFENKLADRFGTMPPPAKALLEIVRIKWLGIRLGIEKILLKNNLLIANFVADPQSSFYRSSLFGSVMSHINKFPDRMKMRQKDSKLTLTISNVRTVGEAIRVLSELELRVS
jgi:transcription-repair coupling factor (superfamily II helicase)